MTEQQALLAKINQLSLQQKALNLQLQQNTQNMQKLVRRVWHLKEKEQKRLATELHDGVGQVLTALVNQLTLIVQNNPDEAQQNALQLAETALLDIRELSRLMRPPILDDLGLNAALKWLLRNMSQSGEFEASLDMSPDLSLPNDIQTVIFRVCQEAMSNVVKYAKASQVSIEIVQAQEGLHLEIKDNGVGFVLEDGAQKGVGLSSIKDRVASYSGRAVIESAPKMGCTISVFIPNNAMRVEE